ncbi:hypothetical protein AQI88_22620 [Streptomyces cellostaticus]|uniref:Extensin n=1 Tax=Streptomyces cellostaticus TaxID=67285 RepID=A0A124HCE4_9ACTN|nr:hypothetical protein [Streptomyces cellostaticus]KUM94173.1 hypothetical protein AQI88_22620 [Streptomyces cellostaticus]GHI05444.1 hypothetical protein Scel_37650 [Streptomyces cellostaticus]
MADEQYKWLTQETAERLLRGESLEAVDASGRDQAEQLGKALGALSAEAAFATGELPGEQAALAAFRKAREAAEAERSAVALGDGTPARRSGRTARAWDTGLVRIGAPARTGIRSGRPRWARPVRLALAAAVAAGTLGGVAMAAGSGVLPMPFHREPGPEASVSAQNSGEPLTSPSPQSTPGIVPDPGTPSAGTSGSAGADPSRSAAGRDKGKDKGAKPGSGDPSGNPGTWWKGAAAACRDIRDGKELGVDRRRVLEGLAGGSARVTKYCKSVLETDQSASGGDGESGDGGKDSGSGKGDGKDKGDGNGPGGDDDGHPGRGGDGNGNGHRGGGHGGRHRDAVATPAPSALAPLSPARATAPAPAPSPTYSAL